jgi:hypothetical protein
MPAVIRLIAGTIIGFSRELSGSSGFLFKTNPGVQPDAQGHLVLALKRKTAAEFFPAAVF